MKREVEEDLQAAQPACSGDKVFKTVASTPKRRTFSICGSLLSAQILQQRASHSYSVHSYSLFG
jgi:hypothetical protein